VAVPAPAQKRSHFSLGGIPVRVEPAFFIIIAILGYNPYRPSVPGVLWWVAIAFVSILVHELGHAIAFRLYGVRPSITLHGMGGLTSGSGELTPMHHIVVSLAGPLSALVLLGIPSWVLAQSGTITSIEGRDAVMAAVWINIGWSLLNLLPILPLDGGQVFAAGVEMATKGRSTKVPEYVSIGVAAVLAVFALYYGVFFGALIAVMFIGINVSTLSRAKRVDLGTELQ
jgi:stage IV sporulation protein FB